MIDEEAKEMVTCLVVVVPPCLAFFVVFAGNFNDECDYCRVYVTGEGKSREALRSPRVPQQVNLFFFLSDHSAHQHQHHPQTTRRASHVVLICRGVEKAPSVFVLLWLLQFTVYSPSSMSPSHLCLF